MNTPVENAIRSIEFDPGKSYLLLMDSTQINLMDAIEAVQGLPQGVLAAMFFKRNGNGEPIVPIAERNSIRQWLDNQEAKSCVE